MHVPSKCKTVFCTPTSIFSEVLGKSVCFLSPFHSALGIVSFVRLAQMKKKKVFAAKIPSLCFIATSSFWQKKKKKTDEPACPIQTDK